MTKHIFSLLFTIVLSYTVDAQYENSTISQELFRLYEDSNLSGFAVSIVSADGILHQESFGFEDIEAEKVFSVEQKFSIASISKTFIGIGLMKLIEQGDLKLSTPINSILPFKVINPKFKDIEIKVEDLARHTSSIVYGELESKTWYLERPLDLTKKDVGKNAFKDFTAWDKNDNISLGEFLKECLTESGKFYSKKRFSKSKPGTHYAYSNIGAALAAYIIELKTGIAYDLYIEELTNKEFDFRSGVWRNTLEESMPTSYFQNKIKTPVHKSNLYPAGGMMLSCNELSLYLIEMIKGYSGDSKVLNPESFQLMMNTKDDKNNSNGLFWELKGDSIGHNGGNYGVTCFMSFNKKTGIGKIFIANISSYNDSKLLAEMITI